MTVVSVVVRGEGAAAEAPARDQAEYARGNYDSRAEALPNEATDARSRRHLLSFAYA